MIWQALQKCLNIRSGWCGFFQGWYRLLEIKETESRYLEVQFMRVLFLSIILRYFSLVFFWQAIHCNMLPSRYCCRRDIVWDDVASETKYHIFEYVYFIDNLKEKSLIPMIGHQPGPIISLALINSRWHVQMWTYQWFAEILTADILSWWLGRALNRALREQ